MRQGAALKQDDVPRDAAALIAPFAATAEWRHSPRSRLCTTCEAAAAQRKISAARERQKRAPAVALLRAVPLPS